MTNSGHACPPPASTRCATGRRLPPCHLWRMRPSTVFAKSPSKPPIDLVGEQPRRPGCIAPSKPFVGPAVCRARPARWKRTGIVARSLRPPIRCNISSSSPLGKSRLPPSSDDAEIKACANVRTLTHVDQTRSGGGDGATRAKRGSAERSRPSQNRAPELSRDGIKALVTVIRPIVAAAPTPTPRRGNTKRFVMPSRICRVRLCENRRGARPSFFSNENVNILSSLSPFGKGGFTSAYGEGVSGYRFEEDPSIPARTSHSRCTARSSFLKDCPEASYGHLLPHGGEGNKISRSGEVEPGLPRVSSALTSVFLLVFILFLQGLIQHPDASFMPTGGPLLHHGTVAGDS